MQNLLTTSRAAREVLAQEKAEIARYIKTNTKHHEWGGMTLLPVFHQAQLGQSAEVLKYILPAVSGQSLSPALDKRMNLAKRLRRPNFSGATLGGVRFVPTHDGVLCVRDLGGLLGRHGVGGIADLHLIKDQSQIWDGRYKVRTMRDVQVTALADWWSKLDKPVRQGLQYIPKAARGGLPVFIKKGQVVFMPFCDTHNTQGGETPDYKAQSLAPERLYALLGELFR